MEFRVVDNFLSDERCIELIEMSEKLGYGDADISFPEGARMIKTYRDNQRCLLTDESLRQELENLILPYVNRLVTVDEYSALTGPYEFVELSGMFRFYKYLEGNFFKKHRDEVVKTENGETLVTVLIYLNDVRFGGGTYLCDRGLREPVMVQPTRGKMLMFTHDVLHSGETLVSGVKYILRTDLIYRKIS